ncbi:MAG: long-chain fatty acid--CoA ligase [Dehalococcoidia bacterium]|nr:MAG: long-chain fatty acid--CoA ligase [Dehalococcoidia bacterium]
MDMIEHKKNLYELSTGAPVTSLSSFASPLDEYRLAFEDRAQPFLVHYAFEGKDIQKRTLNRGEFWDLACSGAAYLIAHRVAKGDRVIHCFSDNSLYDLIFRLAAVLVGCVPVTINWQADDNERIAGKATITDAKCLLYDKDFTGRIEEIKPKLAAKSFLEVEKIEAYQLASDWAYPTLRWDDEKMIIFTSGTTGEPRGASLSHRSYLANRLTFEQYFGVSKTTQLDLLLVNPLHHANSTAFSDLGMRRSGTKVHLIQRYSTLYWKVLVEAARSKRDLLVAPMVSRHIDFLETLSTRRELPVKEVKIKEALRQTYILIGSAPVGPTTVKRAVRFSNRPPNVRFGSTETCLQVMATPREMSKNELSKAFEAGWRHGYKGEKTVGYYIGREHFPFTRVKVVKSTDPESKAYFQSCETGEPGCLITQGPNLMDHYVGDTEATKAVFREGWYTGLGDIAFALKNEKDGQLDYYWMSRESALLIRGGANYACDQIAAELSKVLVEDFQLKAEQFRLAVVGLLVESEHEDSCCVTIELSKEVAHMEPQLEANFMEKANKRVSKSARPDYIRLAKIPVNFKGAVLALELKQDFRKSLEHKGAASCQSRP